MDRSATSGGMVPPSGFYGEFRINIIMRNWSTMIQIQMSAAPGLIGIMHNSVVLLSAKKDFLLW